MLRRGVGLRRDEPDGLEEAHPREGHRDELGEVSKMLDADAASSSDAAKLQKLAQTVRDLAAM